MSNATVRQRPTTGRISARGTLLAAPTVVMDEEAFDAFYQDSFRRLVGQIYAMCGNVAEAQDCVQEAFVRAWDKRRSLDVEQSPEAWVRTVAYRLAVSRWRRARKAFLPADRAHEPPPPQEPDITRVALARALQSLPADQRRAIVLHHLCDMSVADVALEVNAPIGTVKARLSRGRAALALLLADDAEQVRHG
ncbi:MAG: RNA polymerase ECF-type sigma factor [uncultured Propionibacteriaceae bacterium]|uniref:RNA polymerase ECF-type sigma factor n=1 Tax=uncultured Propionibacteriaceae bacterium TaxID=257457 RepID=A0A6J4MY86_9ACTN|nr:MAG: RNA polymerase ECF-type sigma factor [uncultured Propionibacteriaceae bacterium]